MTKPTYDQLLSLVQYLAVRADYENLPLRDESKSDVELCLQKPMINVFDFDDEKTLESVADSIVELLQEYAYNFDYDQRDRIAEVLSENQPL